jgi:hypothetical protein
MRRPWPDLALTQRSRWKAEMMRAQRVMEAEFTRVIGEAARMSAEAREKDAEEQKRVWS